MKLQFSGHESFECRPLWLKKGYDLLVNGKTFNDEAVVDLGVGRNMVTSIKYWMRAYDLLDSKDQITDFANLMFNDEDGLDKYFEDEATIWLLHYQLVTKGFASIYSIAFNQLRKFRPEFTKEQAYQFIISKYGNINESTFSKDFDALTKTYITKGDSADENYEGLLVDLNLIREFKKEKKTYYSIVSEDRINLPPEILLYCILKQYDKSSINFEELLGNDNSVGTIFALDKISLSQKLEELATRYHDQGIVYKDYAGVKELQFNKNHLSAENYLTIYYDQVNAN